MMTHICITSRVEGKISKDKKNTYDSLCQVSSNVSDDLSCTLANEETRPESSSTSLAQLKPTWVPGNNLSNPYSTNTKVFSRKVKPNNPKRAKMLSS